jgi:aminopeptidase N
MARRDPHSYNDDTQAETVALDWRARVDFATRTLVAEATLRLRAASTGILDLDTRGLAIEGVFDGAGRELGYTLHPEEPILGARLEIALIAPAEAVRIRYRTSPEASALQWLEPAQTAGGAAPFLFSQCQAIHARSVVPLQDTPRLRITFTAELDVPGELVAVMAAADRGCVASADGRSVARFEMPQPIPPYLLAFAVGDLAMQDVSPRARVVAEPSVLAAAAREFDGVEAMITAAEALFGPYDWERFDMLVMPSSFPYGGMENPRLTFLTPTLIAGDRSNVNVVGHELAHAWTGNLVTNANAEHFWLNEGFTVYAERRIIAAVDGAEMAELHAALGRRELDGAIARFAAQPELTRLRTRLTGVDPDEAFSLVPYEKGYLFLRALDEAAGRPAFDAWLRSWLVAHRFGAVTTDDFLASFEAALPGVLDRVGAARWLDGDGVPDGAPRVSSARLDAIEAAARGGLPVTEPATPVEWQLYLEALPRPVSVDTCRALDERFALTRRTNHEILVTWLELALRSGFDDVVPRVEEVLGAVGRMKYLRPLYVALAANPATRAVAERVFAEVKARYHPIARQVIEGVLRGS